MTKLEQHRKTWQGKSDAWLFERLAKELTQEVEEIHKLLVENEQLRLSNISNRFSNPKFIDNVCLSYRHDFGLLSDDEQNKIRFECKEWMKAIKNNEPY